jgi:hypothetical protein
MQGTVYTTEACAASGCVYSTYRTPQTHVLHIDVSTLHKGLCCTWTCLHHRGRSFTLTYLHCKGLSFFLRCSHYRSLSCIWTCLCYRSLCCTRTCLHHKEPELHMDLSTLQRTVPLLEVFTLYRGLSCLYVSTLQWLVLACTLKF